jgi:hypothetical protein
MRAGRLDPDRVEGFLDAKGVQAAYATPELAWR